MTGKGAGATHFKFWNSLNAFLHAKIISCIFILPRTSSNKINHIRVCTLHILKYFLTKDKPWVAWRFLFLYTVCLPFQALRYHFTSSRMWRPAFPADSGDLSALAHVLENFIDRSWKTLWKSERIHRSLISVVYSSHPTPSLIFPHSYFNLTRVLKPHSEIPEPGEDLGTRVAQKIGGVEGGRVEAVGFPWSVHSERPKNAWNWLVQGELLHRQLANIPGTSGYVASEQTALAPF